jgi:hypothetical protein
MKDSLLDDTNNEQTKNSSRVEEISQNVSENSQNYDIDMPDYLDDFLQRSKKTVFIIGNNNNINSTTKNRIIKKKKIRKENNIKYIKTENEEKNEIDKMENKKIKITKKINKNIIKNQTNHINYNDIKKTKIIKSLNDSEGNDIEINKENKYNNKEKSKLKVQLMKFDYEQKLSILKKYFYLYKCIFLHKIKQALKSIYILIKTKNCMNLSINKIANHYQGYLFRNKIKFNYVISKILDLRKQKAQKISSKIKAFLIRKEAKKLLMKAENNYIIYSSLNIDKNDRLYFRYMHKSGKAENFYFEYSPLLKCFIYFLNKNNDKYLKIVEGNFYNSKANILIDKSFEVNCKGKNIINIQSIVKNADIINERNDRIINRYLRLHRPVKRTTIDEYEESKKKSKDDSILKNKSKKLVKLRNTSRCKSFIKIKGECKTKSILKPSRSYVNLRCGDKKIQFGKAKIRKYKSSKD